MDEARRPLKDVREQIQRARFTPTEIGSPASLLRTPQALNQR
jgi:hypothetical protein